MEAAWSDYEGMRTTTTEMKIITFRQERLLAACRIALESITHDMGASPQIHQLCVETLELTAPKS